MTLFIFLLFACGKKGEDESENEASFHLKPRSWGWTLMFHDKEERSDTLRYRLVRKGEKVPTEKVHKEHRADIRVPVDRIASLSSTHIGMLRELDASDRLVAFTSKQHLYDPPLRKAMQNGRIESVGNERRVDLERLIETDPELLLSDGMNGSGQDRMERLKDAGIPVLPVLEWKEDHPLDRLEWIRLFGVLVGKKETADSLFRFRSSKYRSIAARMEKIRVRPKVLCNALHKGTWHIPGGGSFMARLIEDAGGVHPWKGSASGALPKGLEEVIDKAGDADVWLNPGGAESLEELRGQDERVERIKAFQGRRVFNNDKRKRARGGNDYWESGVARPDLVLADIAHILHPGRFEEHELFYHRRLPKKKSP